jgi:putative transposase
MVTLAARREAVAHLVETYATSERRACRLIKADRKTVRYWSRRPRDEDPRCRRKELASSAGSAIAIRTFCCAQKAIW